MGAVSTAPALLFRSFEIRWKIDGGSSSTG